MCINIINRESNVGKPGVWIYLIGDRRRYGKFRITSAGNEDDSEEVFAPVQRKDDRNFSDQDSWMSYLILAPYSSNMFQQQPQNFYPEHATSPSTTTIPPGINY